MKKRDLYLLVICLAISELAGFLGSFFNASSLNIWYRLLIKSSLTPPGWVFAPVWTILFLLIGIALYLAIKNGYHKFTSSPKKYFYSAMTIFVVQWLLNIFWSFFFFYLRSPLIALIDIGVLIISIILMIYYFYRLKPLAGYILLPYLAWVCFATYLNAVVLFLN